MNAQFPLYIPSKGRAETRLTSDALSFMQQPHYIIVEQQELELYKQHTLNNPYVTLLVLPQEYKQTYELCDDLGLTKSTGPGPARNFAWQHSIDNGFSWHWVMDDNIRWFIRLNRNLKINVADATIFRCMEDFVLRYTNVGMAGPNYRAFAPQNAEIPAYVTNTRIYSCNLIRNDLPHRWRGRYNEDTILSLDMLKDDWCTIQFNAFLQDKLRTQVLAGGNTQEFYSGEGTAPKSRMLKQEHPDVTDLVWRFGREHHYVDYTVFKDMKLNRRPDYNIAAGNNEYGMRVVKKQQVDN